MRAIKELADRLDGRPAQVLDLGGPDSKPPITFFARPSSRSQTRAEGGLRVVAPSASTR